MELNSYLLTIRMYGGAGAAATWGFEFRTSFSRGNITIQSRTPSDPLRGPPPSKREAVGE